MSQGEEEYALFIGGLRRDRKISVLKKKIIQLFKDGLDISLYNSDVNVIAPPGTRFAFVYLANDEELQHALSKLTDPDSREELNFEFDEIENPSRGLSVQVKLTKKELLFTQLSTADQRAQARKDLIDGKSDKLMNSEVVRLGNAPPESADIKDDNKENENQSGRASVLPGKSSHHNPKANFGHHVKTSTTSLYNFGKSHRKVLQNISTSTTGLISPGTSSHSLPDKYLIIGQYLGNETRNVEFKRGGGQYVKKQLKDHVSKYVCCFLNSGEGGTLLVGVDDNGAVQGVECNQKQENELRLLIDSVIKGIIPQVFPQQYSVTFVPVLELDTEHLTPIADLDVIEIRVDSFGRPDRLYETHRGDVYIRRDGSVQGPLRASDIQEWTRLMHRQEENGRRGELDRLNDELSHYRQREEQLKQEHDQLKEEIEQLHKIGHKKSKACTIL